MKGDLRLALQAAGQSSPGVLELDGHDPFPLAPWGPRQRRASRRLGDTSLDTRSTVLARLLTFCVDAVDDRHRARFRAAVGPLDASVLIELADRAQQLYREARDRSDGA